MPIQVPKRKSSIHAECGEDKASGNRIAGVPAKQKRPGEAGRFSNSEYRVAAQPMVLPNATAVSAMRLEKPHSLSYQDRTDTKLPAITLVWSRAAVDECGSWLKSIDTFGWLVTASTPFSLPFAAAISAWLISSAVVERLATNFRSTTDTFGV